jgi:pimeloyl-ACP methyl ester carboxylesterase
MKITNVLTLPDNRRLAYAEFGKPDGHPVFHFHGSPSSRLEPLLLGDDVFSQLGLRIIAPDRPGMGQSDFQPDRGFSDWSDDVVFLADALGLDKFSILGISGGCGYVAACAAKVPERLHSAVIVLAHGQWVISKICQQRAACFGFWRKNLLYFTRYF